MSRELDAKVAEKVMEWRWKEWDRGPVHALLDPGSHYWRSTPGQLASAVDCDPTRFVPRYSTDISAAMEIVEKIRTLGKRTTITNTTGKPKGPAHWFVEIADGNCANEVFANEVFADAETLPEAICLAALATVTAEEK